MVCVSYVCVCVCMGGGNNAVYLEHRPAPLLTGIHAIILSLHSDWKHWDTSSVRAHAHACIHTHAHTSVLMVFIQSTDATMQWPELPLAVLLLHVGHFCLSDNRMELSLIIWPDVESGRLAQIFPCLEPLWHPLKIKIEKALVWTGTLVLLSLRLFVTLTSFSCSILTRSSFIFSILSSFFLSPSTSSFNRLQFSLLSLCMW